jgi:hypothetical protein
MEKIIQTLINSWTKGVDTYTHNGSTWLIFTDNKQWVIELTERKTLWYNYNFFKQIFEFTSLDVVDNQQYITKWVEDNIINKVGYTEIGWHQCNNIDEVLENGSIDSVRVNEYSLNYVIKQRDCEDTIENGVKETRLEVNITEGEVDDIIQDGVRHTKMAHMKTDWSVDDTIENGVKETTALDPSFSVRYINGDFEMVPEVDKIIKDGVKETKSDDFNVSQFLCEEVIDKGVKETKYHMSKLRVDAYKAVDNGIKETNHVDVMKFFDNKMEDALQNGMKETKYCSPGINEFFLESVIKNGVKETKQKKNAYLILDTSGRELILESHLVVRDGVKETSHRQFLKTYDVKDTIQDVNEHDRWILDGCDDPVDEVLDNGVKITASLQSREYTGDIDEVLGDGVKTSHPRQYVGENIIDKIIETHRDICEYKHTVDYIIQTGIKETHDDVYHHKGRIDGVIKNGVKETVAAGYTDPKTNLLHIKWGTQIDDVLDNGEKINGTYAGGQRQSEKCKSVVEYGTKNPTD